MLVAHRLAAVAGIGRILAVDGQPASMLATVQDVGSASGTNPL